MATKYQHGYAYDLFVSYSSYDSKWARAFHDDLLEDINHFTAIFTFLDKTRIQAGYVWDGQILAAASDSAVLLTILSPQFFQSEYCQKEVKTFIDAFGTTSGAVHRSRIVPVKFLSAAPSDHVLSQVQAESFCSEDADGIPFEYKRGSPRYKEALRRLAVAIERILKTLPPKQQKRPAVYLAPDFQPSSKKLRDSLSHNFDVLPDDPTALITLSPADFQQALEDDFARCFVSIHPLSDAPFAKGLIDAHLEFAKKQNKPRLVWTPDRPDHLTSAGFEWFTSQAEIEDRIRRLIEKPAGTPPEGDRRLIYFLCPDRANKTLAQPMLDALEKRGVDVLSSPLEGPADQALQSHVRALDELDGCLIYYGNVDREWFDAVFLRVQKKIRQRRLRSAIFLAPPPSEHKTHDLRNLGVPIVDGADAAAKAFLGDAP